MVHQGRQLDEGDRARHLPHTRGDEPAWKTADRLDNKWIPVICGTFGGCLGIVAMFIVDGFPANDVLTAIAYGIVSGFSATGIHQAVKQQLDDVHDDLKSAGGE